MSSPDSITDEICTPEWLFSALDREFGFTCDAAASETNALCAKYYTKETDGLAQSYPGERVFCNPPYSRGQKQEWIKKALNQTRLDCVLWVLLLPTMTEQEIFHELVLPYAEVRFIKGRVKFDKPPGFEGKWSSGRDSHLVAIFRNPDLLVW